MDAQIFQESIVSDLSSLIAKDQESAIIQLLQKNPSLNLLTYRDMKCNSCMQLQFNAQVLHIAAFNNDPDIMVRLIQHQASIQEDLKKWVNAVNDEGFPPIYISCYKNNLAMVRILVNYGANLDQKSAQGLFVLHAAAQGDSPVLLKWFIDHGLDLNLKDERGSSALHWAVYAGAENAVNYLLAWKISINDQDTELGYTALHLAASQGYTKIVRKLLVRGANRNIKDFKGKTAFDIAEEKDYPNMKRMLLDKIGIAQLCNLRQPFRPLKRNKYSVIAYLSFFLVCNGYLFYFVYESQKLISWGVTLCLIVMSNLVIYFILVRSDPGRINKKIDLMVEGLVRYGPQRICPDCEIYKPIRSKHCEICKCCVAVYDHHCPWVNNCIGAKNYGAFFIFITILAINMTYSYIILILHLIYCSPQGWLSYLALSICLLITTSFYFPLLALTYIHVKNLIQGISTYERYAFQGRRTRSFIYENSDENTVITSSLLANNQQDHQESNSSCFNNLKDMCWRNGQQLQSGARIHSASVQIQNGDSQSI